MFVGDIIAVAKPASDLRRNSFISDNALSLEASPDNAIIIDPDDLPGIELDDPAKRIVMAISPKRKKYKYILSELDDPNRGMFTQLERIAIKQLEPDLEEPFRAIILVHPDELYYFEDSESPLFSPTVNLIHDISLNHILGVLIPNDARYVVIYKDDGSFLVKIVYRDGTIKIYTQEEILFKFGEWFNELFDRYFAVVEAYSEPYTVYRHQSQSVVIPERKKQKPVNGGPDHSAQLVDGQNGSKPSSGSNSPKSTSRPPLLQSGKVERQLSVPSPEPSHEKPSEAAKASKDDSSLSVIPPKKKSKPERRFMIGKATSELAVSKELQNKGAKKLVRAIAQAITRGELREKFSGLENFPKRGSAKRQIKWLLNHGYSIALSELVVEKTDKKWLDLTAHILLKDHLKRSRCLRRTRIKSPDASHQHSQLAEQLAGYKTPESVTVEKTKPKDQAALLPLLKSGWRIIFANGRKAPLYNSAQQRQILTEAGTSNIDDDLTVSTQRALEFLLWDQEEAARVSKLIAQVVTPDLDARMKEALESTPTIPGAIETALDLASHIRLANHPSAGGGRLTLGPSQRHIKVSYFDNNLLQEHVHIEVSIEFSEIIISNPLQERTQIPLTLAVRNVYQLPLTSKVATYLPDNSLIIASSPSLPSPPAPEQIQRWTSKLRDTQVRQFHENLGKVEAKLLDWDKRSTQRSPVQDIEKLKEDSRKLKVAQQGFTHNFDYAKSWSELPTRELERVTHRLTEAMKQYLQLLDSALENEALFKGPTHQEGWQLVRDYRQYVQDMEAVYKRVEELNQRRSELTAEDFNEIDQLVEKAQAIGGRARVLSKDELPLRRKKLKDSGQLTQEQYDRTEQLRNLYYPLTSAFNIAKAQIAFTPSQTAEDTDFHRTGTFIEENNQEETAAPLTGPEISPLVATMPFACELEDFEPEISGPEISGQPVPDSFPTAGNSDSKDDNYPEDL